jgi:hypothetical protein
MAKAKKSEADWIAQGSPEINRELSSASGYWFGKLNDHRIAAIVEITPKQLKYCDPGSFNKYIYSINFDSTNNKIILNNRDGYSTQDSLKFITVPYDNKLYDYLKLSIQPVLLNYEREEVTFLRIRKKQFDYLKSKMECTNM